ncbi:hypothetical protein [Synechococcus phage BUCT-ZZ01]|nr:hypothetical protein [Synechococcus phage BUCT-ZZ01]
MRKEKGFTLIEAMIVFTTVAIVFVSVIGIFAAWKNDGVTVGINGVTDSRCVHGYVVMQNQNGSTTQLLDEFGKGVPCNKGEIR